MPTIPTWKDVSEPVYEFVLTKQVQMKVKRKGTKQVSIHAALESLIKSHPEFIKHNSK